MNRSLLPSLSRATWVRLVVLLSGCARTKSEARTAADFERAAGRHRAAAAHVRAQATIEQTTMPAVTAADAYRTAQVNQVPIDSFGQYGAGRAAREEQAAAEDEKIAAQMRGDAEMACSHVPISARVTCPGSDASSTTTPLPSGVRITVTGADTESLGLVVKCAVAQAHADRPDGAERCPLLVPGAVVRVVGSAIEITSDESVTVREIQKRAALGSKPP